jgi:hypothetical protein
MAGVAVAGSVFAIYQLNMGDVVTARATEANHPVLESGRKKAGYTAAIFVAGMTLLTRDANVGILGSFSIIAMEINARHAIMGHPVTGKMVPPDDSAYQPVDGSMVPDYPPSEATADFGYDTAYR